MIKNYFKITLRVFTRNKGYSFLNLFGLSIGIAVSIIGFLYVLNELSYDRFNENSERIHRIAVDALIGDTEIYQAYTAAMYTQALYDDFPEIEKVCRISTEEFYIEFEDKKFVENRVLSVDSTFFDMFTFPVVKGKVTNLLNQPNCVVLTESTAQKYFGTNDPINKVIKSGSRQFKVISVIEDIPENSHFHFDMAVSLISFDGFYNNTGWYANNFRQYILLNKNTDYKKVEARLPDFVDKYLYKGQREKITASGSRWDLYLQPLTSIHLNSNLRGEFEANGRKEYVYIFLIVSVFILLIACINFINLSTARATKRSKEVGVRKVVGSGKIELVRQFLGESIITSFIALVLAILMVEICLIYLPDLIGIELSMPYFSSTYILPGLISIGLLVGVFSGLYPAIILSQFKPILVLKGSSLSIGKTSWLRNSLVILQFVISVVLIIGTFLISKQLDILQNKNLGFDKENIIMIRNSNIVENSMAVFKNEVGSLPSVKKVSHSSCLPGIPMNNWGCRVEGSDVGISLNIFHADEDFKDVMNIEISSGRYFSNEYGTDTMAIIINEAAQKLIAKEDILGTRINFYGDRYFHVVGVVKNIHYESKHQKVHPMAILNMNHPDHNTGYITVKIAGGNYTQTINNLSDIWGKHANGFDFDYAFLDNQYDSMYQNEMQTKKLFLAFSFLAVFIACLGLLGLAAFLVQQKVKEIGIRKTFGASSLTITYLLSKEFSKWVLLANIIAWPLAWYFFDQWLNNFNYRTEIQWWYFVIAGLLSFVIALLTVSYQTIKSAKANPIESLRYE